MSDEPSNGELARGISDIKAMLAGLISRAEYTADQRGIQYRLDELARDLSDERRERARDIEAVQQRITEEAKVRAEHRMNWRAWLLTGVLPALATLLGVILALLFAKGGH